MFHLPHNQTTIIIEKSSARLTVNSRCLFSSGHTGKKKKNKLESVHERLIALSKGGKTHRVRKGNY